VSKLDELLNEVHVPGSDHWPLADEARAELAALRQRAEDVLKVIAAERRELWINFHTPTAQAAADELLKRIESAILKANTGS
jgi:hypothetical protein